MLYGNISISHYSLPNLSLWMAMAFQAGFLNIGGFMACQRFVSHITGFATFFGYELNQEENSRAWGMLVVPLFFLFGAMISGQLVDIRLKLQKKPKYYITFGVMFFLILFVFIAGILGFFGTFGAPFETQRNYTLLILLCLASGIQNGTISTVSKSIVRTSHLTGITTDLGLGLIRFFNKKKLQNQEEQKSTEGRANLMRMGIIFFFILGSVAGSMIFGKFGYGGFLVPTLTSGIFFGLMIYFQVLRPQAAAKKINPISSSQP